MNEKIKNIYHRKDGRWEGRYPIGRKADGTLRYGYLYGKTYVETYQKLRPIQEMMAKMQLLYGKSLMTYNEWVLCWKRQIQKTVKESTFHSYCYTLEKYFLPVLGQVPLYQLSGEKIQAVITHLIEENFSPNSIHYYYRVLYSTLNQAVKQGILLKNPCEEIQLPKRLPTKVHALTRQEQQAVVKAIETYSDDRGKAALLALNTGMRIGEIAALTWEKVHFDREIIQVDQTCLRLATREPFGSSLHYDTVKSLSSKRLIPMNQAVKQLLLNLKKHATGPFVFETNEGVSEPRVLTYHFHKIRELAQVRHVHFHQLRHTFATRCLEEHAAIPVVSFLLGHSSTKMTLDIYAHATPEEQLAAVYTLDHL